MSDKYFLDLSPKLQNFDNNRPVIADKPGADLAWCLCNFVLSPSASKNPMQMVEYMWILRDRQAKPILELTEAQFHDLRQEVDNAGVGAIIKGQLQKAFVLAQSEKEKADKAEKAVTEQTTAS